MNNKTKIQDTIFRGLMISSAILVVALLGLVIGYIAYNGIGMINFKFLTSDFDNVTKYVDVIPLQKGLMINVIEVQYDNNTYLKITKISKDSPLKNSVTNNGEKYPLKTGDIIKKIDGESTANITKKEYDSMNLQYNSGQKIRLKIIRPGKGILPLIFNTIYIIILSLLFALPISIFSAIFLAEYAIEGKMLDLIKLTISSLAGIPSIIYGLFVMLAFVKVAHLGYSLLSGSLTLSIVLLPTVIGQTEEAIKRVPYSFKEGSLALGATKLQTIFKVVLPNSISGILVGVLLGVGRVVSESAALLLTAGTAATLAHTLFDSASTLTVKAYVIAKETGDIKLASAVGIVSITLIIMVNIFAKKVEKFDKMKGNV